MNPDTSTLALFGTIIAGVQVLLLTIVTGWMNRRKEDRDAERLAEAAVLAAKLRSQEKAEDYKRQDEVADRVAQVAERAAEAAHEMTKKLDEGLEQGKRIHTLVNSDMTAARTGERDAMALLLISLKSQLALNTKNGVLPLKELQEQIEYAEGRIVELNQVLADRLAAQNRVDAETTAAAAAAKKG